MCEDGEHFVSASQDNTLRLWNIASGACEQVYKGHTKFVRTVAMCKDGKHFVSASWDGTLRLWKLPDCACGFDDYNDGNYKVCKGAMN
jgi:WD40 repeat protein